MKLVTSSFVKGLIGPGSGLGDIFAGKEGRDDFEANVQTASDNFFSQGQAAWDEYKEEEKDIKARIKLLMASGVESKELAVALANQDKTSFDNLIEGYREQQSRTRDNLMFRDYVQAEGLPMEADPTRGPFGPTDERVIADLTDATLDESVSRVVGTVRPGTLSREQESTFTSTLRNNFAKMGLGPRSFRGDLVRQEALESAMEQRPAGVSEEDWLGFIEDKDRERGDPSTVKFRATPFSRAAEIEFDTLEMQFQNVKLDLEEKTAQAKTREEREAMRTKTFKELNIPLSAEFLSMAEGIGFTLTEDTIYKDFVNELELKTPVIELLTKLQKVKRAGQPKITLSENRQIGSNAISNNKDYFGAGVEDVNVITGGMTFATGAVRESEKRSMLSTIADVSKLAFEHYYLTEGISAANAAKLTRNVVDKYKVAILYDQTEKFLKDDGKPGWFELIDNAGEGVEARKLVANEINSQLSSGDLVGNHVSTKDKSIKAIMSANGINDLQKYLLGYAENKEARLPSSNILEHHLRAVVPREELKEDVKKEDTYMIGSEETMDPTRMVPQLGSVPEEIQIKGTITPIPTTDMTAFGTQLGVNPLDETATYKIFNDFNIPDEDRVTIWDTIMSNKDAIRKQLGEDPTKVAPMIRKIIRGLETSTGSPTGTPDLTPKTSQEFPIEFPMEVSPTRQRWLDRKEKLNLVKSKLMQEAGIGTGGRSRAKPRDSVEMRRVAKLSTLMNKLSTDVRDLSESEQEAYDALIKNPIEYIDSLTKNGLGAKKKVTRISDAEAEEYKRQLLELKKSGNRNEYIDLQNFILDKYKSSKEFMRRIGISVS